jgi:hypothetical protein
VKLAIQNSLKWQPAEVGENRWPFQRKRAVVPRHANIEGGKVRRREAAPGVSIRKEVDKRGFMTWVSHQRQPTFSEKSKPIVRWGHKANGSPEVDGRVAGEKRQ